MNTMALSAAGTLWCHQVGNMHTRQPVSVRRELWREQALRTLWHPRA